MYSHAGKRSILRAQDPVKRKRSRETEPVSALDITPINFNWEEHHMRFRRQFTDRPECQSNGTQYMLFLLDTSGSIGSANFERMKQAISKLIRLFCKPIKVAVMTFNHEFNVEFCFNCHENTCDGRTSIRDAMLRIQYRSGTTHTAGATRCACDFLLSERCGLDSQANCISVVYVTDGKSNDPRLEICQEINCLHNGFGSRVRTFAFGINDYNEDEIRCIGQSSDSTSVFRYENFDDFEASLQTVTLKLIVGQAQNQHTCRNYRGVSTPGEISCG